ncbi:hypothetical protein RCCS2_17826 [Roseobacter sp. CCS2]|nr:hypothetical protein RCCS2_17826 [Roseobacter sp. CCS2]
MPWRARSVETAYAKALRKSGCHIDAIKELDRIQTSLIAKDARKIWGNTHPASNCDAAINEPG